jgi:hypothetical protein
MAFEIVLGALYETKKMDESGRKWTGMDENGQRTTGT